MESLPTFFQSSRHKVGHESWHDKGISSKQSTSQWPLSPALSKCFLVRSVHNEAQAGRHATVKGTQMCDEHSTSLVQKIAARFVFGHDEPGIQDVHSERATPLSKGGNPLQQRKLLHSPVSGFPTQSTASESLINKDTLDGLTSTKKPEKITPVPTSVKHNQWSAKDDRSLLGVLVLVWLINQRELLKDLTDLRNKSVSGLKVLNNNQESAQEQLVSLGQQIVTLHRSVREQQDGIQTQMKHMKRLLTVFGMVQLVVVVSMVTWSNISLREVMYNWYNHLKLTYFRPVVSVIKTCRDVSHLLLYEYLLSDVSHLLLYEFAATIRQRFC